MLQTPYYIHDNKILAQESAAFGLKTRGEPLSEVCKLLLDHLRTLSVDGWKRAVLDCIKELKVNGE